MTDLPPVVTRKESGARGNAVVRARYPKATRDAWARKGGRPKDPTLVEILEMERETLATTRQQRRVSLKAGGANR